MLCALFLRVCLSMPEKVKKEIKTNERTLRLMHRYGMDTQIGMCKRRRGDGTIEGFREH